MNEIEKLKSEHKAAMDTCASIGAIVGPSDTMSLSEQVAAIVAENVALKSEILNITFIRDGDFHSCSTRAKSIMNRLVNIETPATDAVIADIEARGVEKFAVEMHADISGDDAREFAQQLRSGKGAAS